MPVVRVALPVPLPQVFDYFAENSSTGDVGRCVRVPFGRGEQNGVIIELADDSDIDIGRLKPVTKIQREVAALPADWLELARFAARYYHAPIGEVMSLALPPGLRQARAVDSRQADPLYALSDEGRQVLAEGHRARRALAAIEMVAAGTRRHSALRAALGSPTPIRDARGRGWLHCADTESPHISAGEPALTAEQSSALDEIRSSASGFNCWLLHGVTGSGKTEVYLQLARQTLASERQVLMLVPEIALTPQLESRVRDRFPNANVVSLHSAQSPGARSSGFVQALEGKAHIVLGTRLAVFTAMPRLGMIIIDEEHDASYAQLEGVRYSARDLAVWRARQLSIPIILGSATPSLESWHHALAGRYRRLTLNQRARAAAMPAVRRIDTRNEKLDQGISEAVRSAIAMRLARGEQSLVFLNRRGYAPVLSCSACGWVSSCEHCSARRVVHLAERRMRCHHCGSAGTIPHTCPDCGNQDIHAFGRGTQRIEERLGELFPDACIERVDRDAVRSRAQWQRLLERIASGAIHILVGTQMMAKGHDFARLTLVGVIGGDASLHAADFRAPERLFQQLMQVGGRAGRSELPGEVLIQTEFPDHPLYACLVAHDYHRFAALALDERRRAGFPPFAFQAMLRADAGQLDEAIDFLQRAAALAADMATPEISIYDPVPMRLTRLARRERGQLLCESLSRKALQRFLGGWVAALYRLPAGRQLRWRIDVDPLDV